MAAKRVRKQEGSIMQIRRFAQYAVAGVLVLMSFAASPVMAQSAHAHAAHDSANQKAKASALVQVVRDATERFTRATSSHLRASA